MRRWLSLVAALAAVALFAGCEAKTASYTNASGTLALSRDDGLLYAVDTDNELLAVVDTAKEEKIAEVKLGKVPERILVGADDTIYVANRGARSVSVIRRGEWTEAARIQVGVEPVGLTLSKDGNTLYVVNSASLASAEVGTLMAVDVKTLTPQWELAVGPEPRSVALIDGNKALVSLYKQGDIVTVDLTTHAVVASSTELYKRMNATALGLTNGTSPDPGFAPVDQKFPGQVGIAKFRPRGLGELAVSPDGAQVYSTSLFSSETVLDSSNVVTTDGAPPPLDPGTGGGTSSYGGGPCSGGAVASAGVVTFEGTTAEPQVDDVSRCFETEDKNFPGTVLRSPDGTSPIQGPVALAVDPTGSWLFVVNHESDNVAVMPTVRRGMGNQTFGAAPFPDRKFAGFGTAGVRELVHVGAGPTGIALSRDGRKAYVYNSFDHTISTLTSEGGRISNSGRLLTVAQDVLPPAVVAGRKLFFSATDSRMNNPSTGIACASCHLEGREDGHVWNFAEGPRQTPSLAGRMTSHTAPFHWNGEFNTLGDFLAHTVRLRMGGTGATPAMEQQLLAYIDSIQPPDNPHQLAVPSEAQVRGAQAFQKANCQSCHAGEALTNNTFADVGTFVTVGDVKDNTVKLAKGLNTPSLLAVARTGPYLHDGSAPTLKERLVHDREKSLHGQTALLTDAELDDLVEYLKSL